MAEWRERVDLGDVWHSREHTWSEIRDITVARLKKTEWYKLSSQVQDLVLDLEAAPSLEEFNYCWDWLYDEADMDRVWIATF